MQMKEFRELLETRRDGPDAVVTAAAGWAAIERTLADEPAFAACPPPARLRVWLQVLKQLIDAEHAAWETEDRARLRKERKRAARACDHTCMCRMHAHPRAMQRSAWCPRPMCAVRANPVASQTLSYHDVATHWSLAVQFTSNDRSTVPCGILRMRNVRQMWYGWCDVASTCAEVAVHTSVEAHTEQAQRDRGLFVFSNTRHARSYMLSPAESKQTPP